MDHLCFSAMCLLCLCVHLFICALWSPAGKGLTAWLSFFVSNCDIVTVPHRTQDTNGKVTNSQLDTTNESQEVSPFPAGDNKSHIIRRAKKSALASANSLASITLNHSKSPIDRYSPCNKQRL